MILDTDILVGFLRNEPDAIKFFKSLETSDQQVFITTINAFELYKGAYNSDNQESSLNYVADIIHRFENTFEFDLVASRIAGQIINHLKKKGIILDLPDIFISAIALANNESIVTRNINHFKRIPDLNVIKW